MRRSVRISKELSQMEREPPPGVSCWMKEDSASMDQLQARRYLPLFPKESEIVGDETTPYSGGVFDLEIQVPDRYPMEPPKVRFLTPIYHPNIDTAGRICLDLLKMPPAGSWRPILSIAKLLTSIRLLMSQPNPDDPLMTDISAEFKTNRVLYEQKAKQHTQKHAMERTAGKAPLKPHTSAQDHSDSHDDSQSDSSSDDSSQSDSSSDESDPLTVQLASQKSTNQGQGLKRPFGQDVQPQPHAKKLKEDNL